MHFIVFFVHVIAKIRTVVVVYAQAGLLFKHQVLILVAQRKIYASILQNVRKITLNKIVLYVSLNARSERSEK